MSLFQRDCECNSYLVNRQRPPSWTNVTAGVVLAGSVIRSWRKKRTRNQATSTASFVCSCLLVACLLAFLLTFSFSSPEPRSLWPAAGIESSGFVQHRKSAIYGLAVKSGKSDWLRIWNEYSAHAQKIGSDQSSRSLPQVRRIVALGTRMWHSEPQRN